MLKNPIEIMRENLGEIGRESTLWEFSIRMLCQNLKLEAYQYQEKEDRDILYASKLNKVLDRLYAKYPYISFDFSHAQKIRNAILHSNFLELTEIVHEGKEERYYTPVVGMQTDCNGFRKPTNLAVDLPKGDLKKVGVFGLFLRSINKKITEESISILKAAIHAAEELQELRALSFETDYFSNFFEKGQPFSKKDYESFYKTFHYKVNSTEEAKAALNRFYFFSTLNLPEPN